jgi:hypothetical protein
MSRDAHFVATKLKNVLTSLEKLHVASMRKGSNKRRREIRLYKKVLRLYEKVVVEWKSQQQRLQRMQSF